MLVDVVLEVVVLEVVVELGGRVDVVVVDVVLDVEVEPGAAVVVVDVEPGAAVVVEDVEVEPGAAVDVVEVEPGTAVEVVVVVDVVVGIDVVVVLLLGDGPTQPATASGSRKTPIYRTELTSISFSTVEDALSMRAKKEKCHQSTRSGYPRSHEFSPVLSLSP